MELESFWCAWATLVIPCHFTLIARPQEIRDLDHKLSERGRGNVCSVEESTS